MKNPFDEFDVVEANPFDEFDSRDGQDPFAEFDAQQTIPGEVAQTLPEPPKRPQGAIAARYGLSDNELKAIEDEWKAGFAEKKDADVDLVDRTWLNARQSFYSNTMAGMIAKKNEAGGEIENAITKLKSENARAEQVLKLRASGDNQQMVLAYGYGGYGSLSNDDIANGIVENTQKIEQLQPALRQATVEGLKKQARRAGEYAGMPSYSGAVEGIASLTGQLAGGVATPETFIPGGAGKTVLGTMLKQGTSNALVNAATNPFVQAGNMASGDQEEFSMKQFAADVAVGVAAPAIFSAPGGLFKFLKSRGASDVKAGLAAEGAKMSKVDAEDGIIGDIAEEAVKNKPKGPLRRGLHSMHVGVEALLTPISSRLERMSPGLGKVFRRHAFEEGLMQAQAHKTLNPFLKSWRKLPKGVQAELDLASKNQDSSTISDILGKYHMLDEYKAVRAMLDDFHTKADDAGFDVGYLKDYFPRKIKDYEGYMDFLHGQDSWAPIDKAMRDEAKRLGFENPEALPIETKAEIANKVLRGYASNKVDLGATGNLKARKIKELNEAAAEFYEDTPTALLRYVDGLSRQIADRQFFGKRRRSTDVMDLVPDDPQKMDISLDPEIVNGYWRDVDIGRFVVDMTQKNNLNASQQKQLIDITNAYFKGGSMSKGIQVYRSAVHISTLGSPISTMTQFKDLIFGMYKNGAWNAALGIKDAALPKRWSKKISREDIGQEFIAAEFASFKGLQRFTDHIFRSTGFSQIDKLGKEAFINGRFRQIQKRARAPVGSKTYNMLFKELEPALGQETKAGIEAFARGDKTDVNVRFALFDSLSQFQPITRAEMPQKYLSSPNGKIFYSLKTFTLRQFDMLRTETLDEMKKGNVAKGLGNLAKLGAYWITMGATIDQVKDYILNRENSFSDAAIENMLQAFGVTRWTIYQGKETGPATALFETIKPPYKFFDALFKDAQMMTQGEWELKHSEAVQYFPWTGKIYYWREGKGKEKEERRRRRDN